MPNLVNQKLLAVASTAFVLFGCNGAKQTEVKEKSTSNLPVVKVDNDHTQIKKKDDKSKHLIYELNGPIKEFYLDTSSFNFNDYDVPEQNETAHKAIQIMHAPMAKGSDDPQDDMKVSTMPFDEKITNQKIELLRTVDANNIIVIAIGWEATVEGKIDMKPVWLGSIRIK